MPSRPDAKRRRPLQRGIQVIGWYAMHQKLLFRPFNQPISETDDGRRSDRTSRSVFG
jgi:hypothetical protein